MLLRRLLHTHYTRNSGMQRVLLRRILADMQRITASSSTGVKAPDTKCLLTAEDTELDETQAVPNVINHRAL